MRTPLLASLIAILIPACTDGITGVGGDDQMQGGATCGNGVVETGEQCDDMNTAAGDGCSATCQNETSTPKLNVSVDKTTITTELKTSHPIMVTLAGVGGFGETVNLTASVVNANDVAIQGWSVTLDSSSVTVPMNGTAMAVATLKVGSLATALTGTVKIVAASSLGSQTISTDVTAANQVTFTFHVDDNTGQCVYPTDGGSTANKVPVSIGTKIRWFNDGTVGVSANYVIHVNNSPVATVTHQGQSPNGLADPTTEPQSAYEQTGNAAGTVTWYCHSPGPDMGTADPSIQLQ